MFSKMTCVGRLTQDVELRRTQDGTAVATVRLAVERDYRSKNSNEREADFFRVVLWRALAENAAKYLSKGRLILVEGRLRNAPWTDKNGLIHRDELLEADRWYFMDAPRPDGGAPDAAALQQASEEQASEEQAAEEQAAELADVLDAAAAEEPV